MKSSSQKIQEIQFLEQNLQNLILQKQAFQIELSETVSSLKELENSDDEVFKMIGQLMLKTEKSKIKEELSDKKRILEMRINSIEKQETALAEQLDTLREEIMNGKK